MVLKNLSVCLSVCYKLWPQLSLDCQNRMVWNCFRTSMPKTFSQKIIFPQQGAVRARAESQINCVFEAKFKFLGLKWIPRLAPFAGIWNLPHKFHLYLIYDYNGNLMNSNLNIIIVWVYELTGLVWIKRSLVTNIKVEMWR